MTVQERLLSDVEELNKANDKLRTEVHEIGPFANLAKLLARMQVIRDHLLDELADARNDNVKLKIDYLKMRARAEEAEERVLKLTAAKAVVDAELEKVPGSEFSRGRGSTPPSSREGGPGGSPPAPRHGGGGGSTPRGK